MRAGLDGVPGLVQELADVADALGAGLVVRFGRQADNIFLVFPGFAIGWLSATIARYVYPPPKKYRQDAGNAR